ncbi:hypothetical protein AKH21_03640 [Pelagibacteraceae bacterium GOM-A5]|nr:hypothetical protein AKH21_03640 [Pelagibacteraceae bacterium GOM-A5]
MNFILKRKNIYLIILIYSFFALLFAVYIEKVLGYLPCKLCIYQRIPFLVSVFICFLGYNYFKSDRILIALIITFTLSVALAGYHFGIENSIFEEYAGCTNTNIDITNKEKIIESLGMVKNCKEVEFTILGISLSGLNFITSLLIVLISLRALVYEKN